MEKNEQTTTNESLNSLSFPLLSSFVVFGSPFSIGYMFSLSSLVSRRILNKLTDFYDGCLFLCSTQTRFSSISVDSFSRLSVGCFSCFLLSIEICDFKSFKKSIDWLRKVYRREESRFLLYTLLPTIEHLLVKKEETLNSYDWIQLALCYDFYHSML